METEFDDIIVLCRQSVEALEQGHGTTDDCCVKTRLLRFVCRLLLKMSLGILTPARADAILDIFRRAKSAALAKANRAKEEASTPEAVDAAKKQAADARRIAGRAEEMEVLLRPILTEQHSASTPG